MKQAEKESAPTLENVMERMILIYRTEGYRTKTIGAYRQAFEEFTRLLGNPPVAHVTESDLRRYIAYLQDAKGLSPVTINIRLSSVRAMFKRMVAEGLAPHDPGERIRKLKTDESRIFTLSDDQVRRLFAVMDTSTFPVYRDYVAMLTMLKCGLRTGEITSLKISDVDFDNNVLLLPGVNNKSRRVRMVPITSKVKAEISQLVEETRSAFPEVELVFTSQFGEELRFDRIRKRMDIYGKKSGVKNETRTSPHSLRHTFAVNYLRNGGDIRSLQMILGHKDISTTQRYLGYADDVVIERYNHVNKNDTLDV